MKNMYFYRAFKKIAAAGKNSYFDDYSQILPVFSEIIAYLWKKKKSHIENMLTTKQVHILPIVANFADFWPIRICEKYMDVLHIKKKK